MIKRIFFVFALTCVNSCQNTEMSVHYIPQNIDLILKSSYEQASFHKILQTIHHNSVAEETDTLTDLFKGIHSTDYLDLLDICQGEESWNFARNIHGEIVISHNVEPYKIIPNHLWNNIIEMVLFHNQNRKKQTKASHYN